MKGAHELMYLNTWCPMVEGRHCGNKEKQPWRLNAFVLGSCRVKESPQADAPECRVRSGLKDAQVPLMWTLEEAGGLGCQEGLSCPVVPAGFCPSLLPWAGLGPPPAGTPQSAAGHCPHSQGRKTLFQP